MRLYRLVGTFHSNGAVEMAVRELLQIQQPEFYRDEIFKLIPTLDSCISMLGEYSEE
jgi:hypothetical protein